MLKDPNQKRVMPDVAVSEPSEFLSPLEWVGMEKIALPIVLSHGAQVLCEADIFVNLSKENAKGIHMSRPYLALQQHLEHQRLTFSGIKNLLSNFVETQEGLSDSAKIVLRWQELHKRNALLSENKGWKEYPVSLEATLVRGELKMDLNFSVFYSSACPCSAALARQLYQQAFSKEFCEENISYEKVFEWLGKSKIAAPHSQRSRADIALELDSSFSDIEALPFINKIEDDLQTPVQTAVKREDEQEFARLNGENSMFVEDALRIMKSALDEMKSVKSFKIKTHHFESLHAHDAVGSILSH